MLQILHHCQVLRRNKIIICGPICDILKLFKLLSPYHQQVMGLTSPRSEAQAHIFPLRGAPGECYYNTLLCSNAFLSSSVVLRAFSALCVYSKFGHHPHPLGYLCAKLFSFCCSLHCWANPYNKIAYAITQSVTHWAYLMPREPNRLHLGIMLPCWKVTVALLLWWRRPIRLVAWKTARQGRPVSQQLCTEIVNILAHWNLCTSWNHVTSAFWSTLIRCHSTPSLISVFVLWIIHRLIMGLSSLTFWSFPCFLIVYSIFNFQSSFLLPFSCVFV